MIWPDNDEPGRRYASDVARLAASAGAASVRLVTVPHAWPAGWDLADELPEGVTVETLCEMIATATESLDPESPAAAPANEPTPLARPMPPVEPYPLDGLGPLAEVARALNEIVRSPPAMCANTVLAVTTLAAQAHIDVELPICGGATRPCTWSRRWPTLGASMPMAASRSRAGC